MWRITKSKVAPAQVAPTMSASVMTSEVSLSSSQLDAAIMEMLYIRAGENGLTAACKGRSLLLLLLLWAFYSCNWIKSSFNTGT